jgi:polyhydroxyalkanoate synthesis regulator phasin
VANHKLLAPEKVVSKKPIPPKGPWKKGQSGNPAGRPRGIPNPQSRLRNMIDAEAIVKRLELAALEGDVQAARTLLERALPVYRVSSAPIAMPELEGAQSLTDKANAVLSAVGNGRVPPDLGAQLVAAIGAVSRLSEVDELLRRVEALEEAKRGKAS